MARFDVIDSIPVHPQKKYEIRAISDIKMIVVHTTDWDTTPQKLARYDITPYFIVDDKKVYNHISRSGCPAITYHEGIMRNGDVYATLRWNEISWHAGKWNPQALGIACYYRPKDGVPEKMYESLVKRCTEICFELQLTPDKVVGHRELKGTGWFWHKGSKKLRKTCPGMDINLDYLRLGVCMKLQSMLGVEIDGNFGPQSIKALMER